MVKIEEPDEAKAINMMRAISVMLANHHGVRIMDEAIIDSVVLSSRYITARQLPDKSVSLLDTACARVSLSQSTTPAAIEDTRRQITQHETNIISLERENATLGNCDERIAEINAEREELESELEIQTAQWEKELTVVKEIHELQKQVEDDFHAQKLSDEELKADNAPKKLDEAELDTIKTNLHSKMDALTELQGENPLIQVNVDSQSIAEVVANWTGIPVGKMVSDENYQYSRS